MLFYKKKIFWIKKNKKDKKKKIRIIKKNKSSYNNSINRNIVILYKNNIYKKIIKVSKQKAIKEIKPYIPNLKI